MRSVHARCTLAAVFIAASASHAEIIYGLSSANQLVTFDHTTPQTRTVIGPLTGAVTGHTVRSIDFRPSNGQLYALSTNGTTAAALYTVNLTSGALTQVGGGTITLTGVTDPFVSIDFNPVADALRVVSANTTNATSYRVNANAGTLLGQDGNLLWTPGDPNFSEEYPDVVGIAYSNNVAGAGSTTLYGYDFHTDSLFTIGSVGGTPVSPNTGTSFSLNSTGSGIVAGLNLGFDISGASGTAYISATDGANSLRLYSANLTTGLVSQVGDFGAGFDLLDISVVPIPEPGTLSLCGSVALAAAYRLRRRKAA